MSIHKLHFRLGMFTLGAAVLIVVGIVMLGEGILFHPTLLVETYFDQSVSGLTIGAPVRQRGVDIGTVTKINFVTSKYKVPAGAIVGGNRKYSLSNLILVEMTIDRDRVRPLEGPTGGPKQAVDQMINDGLRLRLVTSLLGGGGYIDADFVENPSRFPRLDIPWKPTDIYIPSVPTAGGQLLDTLDEIAESVKDARVGEILKHVDAFVMDANRLTHGIDTVKLQGEIDGELIDLRKATASIQKILDDPHISEMLANANSAVGNVQALTDPEKSNVAHLVADLRQTVASLHTLLDDPALKQAIGNTGPLTTDARRALGRISELLANEQQDLAQMIQSLNATAQNVESITNDAKENPARILFGSPPPQKPVIVAPESK